LTGKLEVMMPTLEEYKQRSFKVTVQIPGYANSIDCMFLFELNTAIKKAVLWIPHKRKRDTYFLVDMQNVVFDKTEVCND